MIILYALSTPSHIFVRSDQEKLITEIILWLHAPTNNQANPGIFPHKANPLMIEKAARKARNGSIVLFWIVVRSVLRWGFGDVFGKSTWRCKWYCVEFPVDPHVPICVHFAMVFHKRTSIRSRCSYHQK